MTLTARPARASLTHAWQHRLLGVVFYGGLALLMFLILTTLLDRVLPTDLANRLGYNSEGYTLALVVCAWIQAVRPRLSEPLRWWIALAAGLGCAAIGLGLYASELPSQLKTLNETFIALALILPYLTLARPLRRWVPLAISTGVAAAVVLGVVLGSRQSPFVLLAETMAMLFLVPLALDVVDRAILEPRAPTSAVRRYGWYAMLVVVPLAVVLLGTDARSGDGFAVVLDYLGRVHESVIGVLLVHVYLAVGLRRSGSPLPASPHRSESRD
ncbi:MAG: hypothetical protein H0V64_13130 [Geodermatophilaceae bacterium]|nr:hypothetical protein [Geodermatophilaceae bacterium]